MKSPLKIKEMQNLLRDKGVSGPGDHFSFLGTLLPSQLKANFLIWDSYLTSVQTVVKKELLKKEL